MQPSFHVAHTKIQKHCVFNVDEYATREAQPVSAKNRKLMFCPDYLHRVINTNDCPSVVSCSPGYVLCEDNTCRKSMSICPVTRLCEYFTCSDGRCVKDNTQCPSNIVCGYGKKLCSDRLCHNRSEDCPQSPDQYYSEALQKGLKVCRGGGIVAMDQVCSNHVRACGECDE